MGRAEPVQFPAIINWENGTRRNSVDCAGALAHRYGVSLDGIHLGRWSGLSQDAADRLRNA